MSTANKNIIFVTMKNILQSVCSKDVLFLTFESNYNAKDVIQAFLY